MNYWFRDNWNGKIRSFKTKAAAVKAAYRQMKTVAIYRDRHLVTRIKGNVYYA